MCKKVGCKREPIFNTEGEVPIYCNEHKLVGMVDVVHKKCIHDGCKKRPSFNKEGEVPIYCGEHKLGGMVDVLHKRCIHDGCKKRPSFNKEGEVPIYCNDHKLVGIVNVLHKRCLHDECKRQPTFNIEGEQPIYCGEHKLGGMVDVRSKRCFHDGCKRQPTFNKEGERPIYCGEHKLGGMVDVRSKRCKSSWCSTLVQEKYDGYCLYCYIHLFPDKPVSRNYKTKEVSVLEYVKSKFNQNWIADKRIRGGCSRRRPDLLLDLGDQILIVEVDEDQHISYDCSCENKRIMELSQDVGHLPIVLIRFNPDKYTKDGKTIASCWAIDNKGIYVVKKTKKEEWLERLSYLENVIDYWITNRTNKTIEVIQLFY